MFILKARQVDLFDQQVQVRGHARKDGAYVKPHAARRKKARQADHYAGLGIEGSLKVSNYNKETGVAAGVFHAGKMRYRVVVPRARWMDREFQALGPASAYATRTSMTPMAELEAARAHSPATIDKLRENIKLLAAERGETEIQVITALQASAALTDNEQLLDLLAGIKWELIEGRRG